jgi:hypothetical protein
MTAARVLLTAGHGRSVPCEALAELLRRDGVDVAGILVVSVFGAGRIRGLMQQQGLGGIISKIRQRSPRNEPSAHGSEDPLERLLREHAIRPHGIRAWCRASGVPCWVVRDLNAVRSIETVTRASADACVYVGGGILRRPFLEAARRVINAHAGPLPEVRGMNAAEWAALLRHRQEVTVHLIDEGIDTGPVLRAFRLAHARCASIQHLRGAAVARGIEGLREVVRNRQFDPPGGRVPSSSPTTRQCFIMAPALLERLDQRLRGESCE